MPLNAAQLANSVLRVVLHEWEMLQAALLLTSLPGAPEQVLQVRVSWVVNCLTDCKRLGPRQSHSQTMRRLHCSPAPLSCCAPASPLLRTGAAAAPVWRHAPRRSARRAR